MHSILFFFHLFWTLRILRWIVIETNNYEMEEENNCNINLSHGRENWKSFTISKLKGFIRTRFLMGLKKQPNTKNYWHIDGSIFHYSFITKLMSQD